MNSSNNLHKFAVTALLTATALIVCSNGVFAAETMIYGRVSTSLRVTKADGEPTKVDMNNEGSRWGLRTEEHINPDLSAKIWLESGFNSDDGGLSGTGGGNLDKMIFDRHAVLSLASKKWGEIGFGRMGSVRSAVMPYSLVLLPLDPVNGAYYDIASISVMFGADPRANNTVTYVSPRMRGFKFGASYSFATTDQEEPEITSNNRLLALGGNYEDGSIGAYFGATHVWHGKTSAASADRESVRNFVSMG